MNNLEISKEPDEIKFEEKISEPAPPSPKTSRGLHGPSFVIGPDNQATRIAGAQPYEVFHNIFQEELKK